MSKHKRSVVEMVRQKLGLTQKEMAHLMGLSPGQYLAYAASEESTEDFILQAVAETTLDGI